MSRDIKDVPPETLFKALQGHGTPKKSKIIWLQDAKPDPIRWLGRTQLKRSIRAANAAKRFGGKRFKRQLSQPAPKPCLRRLMEFMGLSPGTAAYSAPVHLLECLRRGEKRTRIVYELQLAFEPFCSFTDWKEAEASCLALQAEGFLCGVDLKDLSKSY